MDTPSLRPRRDGWTPAAQAAFIAARAGGATIAAAAAAAGLSRQAAYKLRAHPAGAALRAAWGRTEPLTDDEVDAILARTDERARSAPVTISNTDLLRALRKRRYRDLG